jgi:hypothetical protein
LLGFKKAYYCILWLAKYVEGIGAFYELCNLVNTAVYPHPFSLILIAASAGLPFSPF